MSRRLLPIVACASFAVTAFLAARAAAREERVAAVVTPEVVKWNLERLNKDPFKLIKATPDPLHRQVRFVVEFERRPELSEMYDWEHRGGPLVFRFQDEDGIVLKTVRPTQEGEFIPEKGVRIRFVLQMPDEQTLARTRSVKAD
jgi:hypothetical protein